MDKDNTKMLGDERDNVDIIKYIKDINFNSDLSEYIEELLAYSYVDFNADKNKFTEMMANVSQDERNKFEDIIKNEIKIGVLRKLRNLLSKNKKDKDLVKKFLCFDNISELSETYNRVFEQLLISYISNDEKKEIDKKIKKLIENYSEFLLEEITKDDFFIKVFSLIVNNEEIYSRYIDDDNIKYEVKLKNFKRSLYKVKKMNNDKGDEINNRYKIFTDLLRVNKIENLEYINDWLQIYEFNEKYKYVSLAMISDEWYYGIKTGNGEAYVEEKVNELKTLTANYLFILNYILINDGIFSDIIGGHNTNESKKLGYLKGLFKEVDYLIEKTYYMVAELDDIHLQLSYLELLRNDLNTIDYRGVVNDILYKADGEIFRNIYEAIRK